MLLIGAGVKAPAASATSFASMEGALQAVAGHQFQPVDAVDKEVNLLPQCEIVCRRPGESVRSGKKPLIQFYVNVWASDPGSIEGEGTESFPWSGVNSAVAALLRQHQEGTLRLKPGQRLLISHKEPFTPSALERRKKIKETIAEYVFLAMTGMLVLPVVLILGFLVVKAWPALSFSFLFQNPTNNMTAGGIWQP